MDHSPAGNHSARGERLDSWKEIAAYLKRDIRTVQRWEKQEALPVHRHLHDERGTAYAYSGEIDKWLQSRSGRDLEVAPSADAGRSEPVRTARASLEKWSRLPVLIAGAVVLVAGIIVIWALVRPRHDPTPLSSLSIVFAPSEQILEWGPDTALSPDGSTLVYTTVGLLKVRRIDELSARAVPGTSRSSGPFFSPDGRWIGFNQFGELMKVAVEGGAPVRLGVTTKFTGAADWGADDHIVYADITPDGTHGLYRVAATGGTPQLVAALDGKADYWHWLTPQSVANGRIILCTLARSVAHGTRFQVVAVSVATGERRVLVDDAQHGMYVGDGVLVYSRSNALFATRLDVDRVEVSGPHVPAMDAVGDRQRFRAWTSAAGMLVYWPDVRVARRLVWVDRSGKQEPLPLPPAMYLAPRVSPDGRSIAYAIGHHLSSDLWKYDVAAGSTVKLTSDGRSVVPLWTPDGTRLIFSQQHATGGTLAQLHLSQAGEPEPIALPPMFGPGESVLPVAWASDGQTLLLRRPAERAPPVWAVSLDGSRDPHPIATSSSNAHLSPDARWIAYRVGDPTIGAAEVYVAPFPAGRPEWKVSTSGGFLPIWGRSGREIFYRRGNGIMAVPVTVGQTFTSGTPQLLFEVPFFEGEPGSPNYDVAADDQRFVMVLPATTGGPDRLHVVQGWKAEILRRLSDAR